MINKDLSITTIDTDELKPHETICSLNRCRRDNFIPLSLTGGGRFSYGEVRGRAEKGRSVVGINATSVGSGDLEKLIKEPDRIVGGLVEVL